MKITDALNDYVHSKLASLEKFIPRDAHVHIEIGRPSAHHKTGDDVYIAEIEIDAVGQTYFIHITDANQYAAIDRARDEIIEMVKEGRGKRQTLIKRGHMLMKDMMRYDVVGSMKRLPKRIRNAVMRESDES